MKSLKFLWVIILSISMFACGGNEEIAINPAFTGYISSFSSGILSNSDVVTIQFTQDISKGKRESMNADDLFDFSPDVEGELFWTDERTVEFRPSELMKSGERYVVEFELGDLIEVQDDLETFEFSFQIIEQAVFVEMKSMESYNMTDLTWQKVSGQVQTADFAPAEIIESMFGATQDGKKMSLKWTHWEGGRLHDFVIDSVSRMEERSAVSVSWDNDVLEVSGDSELEYVIPSLSEFMVMDVEVIQEPNQRIEIRFSDPLKPNQSLSGLIYFSSDVSIRTAIDGNLVTVFPQKKLMGDHELVIENYIVNVLDYELMEGKKQMLAFTSHKPAVEMLGKGTIVPNSGGVVLPFKAVNLSSVDVRIVKVYEDNVLQFLQSNNLDGNEQMRRVGRLVHKGTVNLKSDHPINYSTWNNFYLDLSEHIETEPGAIYRVSMSFRPSQSLYTCSNKVKDHQANESALVDPEFAEFDEPTGSYSYYRDYYYEGYIDGYDWNEQENPCHISYYVHGNNVVSRNVLASDLGIIAKGGNEKELHVFVTDLKSSDPLSGIEVEIYNFQQQLISTATTDGEGMVAVDVQNQVPYIMIAKSGGQRGYLRLDDGTSRSVSMFNVGGKKLQKGLKGFIYGERGVWRPGDSLFLTFMLEDQMNMLPKGHPVVMELYTPENKLYTKKIQVSNLNGFYDFRTSTHDQAPTGNWQAKVKVGGASFYKRIKIESIKPNRLKIDLDFGTDILKKGRSIEGDLSAMWLHGAKAPNLNAKIEMSLSSTKTKFEDYPDFYFDDPSKDFSAEEKVVFEGNTDGEGKATVFPNINIDGAAPGMLNARFVTRVFERGGDFSIDRYDVDYSPFDSYVGVKVPEGKGWNGAIFSDETTLVPIVSVDQKGNPIDRRNLKVEIYEIDWRWWWEHSNHYDLAHYVSSKSNYLRSSGTVNTVNGKATFEMKFKNQQYGRRLMLVTDPVSGHTTGQIFYLSYSGWWNDPKSEGPGGAEMLTFTTDKKEYEVGETVKINMPAFQEGRALITLEDGSKVVDKFWVTPDEVAGGIEITATEAMTPNVFVNISLIQPHHKTTNNLPMRLYGIEKIKVVDKKTLLHPVIEMSDNLEPEKPVKINVSEQDGKPMTYTIAVVDDGLLDLTRFKTPDPWTEFFTPEALGVKTWDLYPYVLGDFGSGENSLLAIGGDDYMNNKGNKKANRFKPVVHFFGPFELGSGDDNDHEFIMPNYIGSVRTMVVAGQDGAYGSAEFNSKVKKPVMILPTVPRVIGPGERMQIPVSVFAMDKSISSVKVEMKTNSNLKVIGSSSQTVSFSEEGEQMVYFEAIAKEVIGIGELSFVGASASYTSTYDVEMEVRAANPTITKVIDGRLDANGSWVQNFEPFGVSGTELATLELTSLPPIGVEKHLKYLIRYPYGCIEQTTSSVFAQLVLPKLVDLDDEQEEKIQININAGIQRIMSFQTSTGGLSYWPGETYISEWGTNYGGHFIIEAKEQGYSVPSSFMKQWVNCQRKLANSWRKSMNTREQSRSSLIQSYRLYLLAKAGSPALGAMNRLRQSGNLTTTSSWRLACAYALAGKKDVAKSMVANIDYEVEDYRELTYTYGSRDRDRFMILEVMAELEDPSMKDLLIDAAKRMSEAKWLSTQERSYGLLAIAKASGADGDNRVKASITINGKKIDVEADKAFYQMDLPAKRNQTTSVMVNNKAGKILFARLYQEGVPMAGEEEAQSSNLSIDVRFLDTKGYEINPEVIEQGKDFVAEVKIKNPGTRGYYYEMALNQVFPSGWEIRNTRMDKVDGEASNAVFRYQDIRDDRVYTYFNLDRGSTKTFRILLNATYAGRFYLPAFVSSAMYDDNIKANSRGRWVEVVDPTVN